MQVPNSPFTTTGSASNSLPTLKLATFVGPTDVRKARDGDLCERLRFRRWKETARTFLIYESPGGTLVPM